MSVSVSAGNAAARRVFAGLPPRYDQLAWLLSFGQDRVWRRAVVDRVAEARPALALDVATGPAGVALAVAERTGARVVGVDLNEPMLREGVANVRRRGLAGRVQFALARGEDLPFRSEAFDAVTFAYLLRYVDDPASTLAELARCLRPGGVMACLEFFVPPRAGWRALWRLYTRLVLPAAGGVTGGPAWWSVGRFLGPSIDGFYQGFPLPAQLAAWREAGLVDVGHRVLSVGGGVVIWGTKAGG